MIIRKLFKFENAHIVRNCTSHRCKWSIHGHSYKVEVLLEGLILDNGGMVYDFGLFKSTIGKFLDAFDHAITLWDKDKLEYLQAMKAFSERWIELPVSPSAENFARLFFVVIDEIINNTIKHNGEGAVTLASVIVHETDTGYAQAFRHDAYSPMCNHIDLKDIVFSAGILNDAGFLQMWEGLLYSTPFINPIPQIQVEV